VIQVAGAHTVVELMRRGASPTEACLGALARVVQATRVPYLLDERGRPRFDVKFYAVDSGGSAGGAAIWSGARYAVARSGEQPALHDCAHLYERD
jgi:N4-(beta-N-acetylglucosaminyl)-L-asparaginase